MEKEWKNIKLFIDGKEVEGVKSISYPVVFDGKEVVYQLDQYLIGIIFLK